MKGKVLGMLAVAIPVLIALVVFLNINSVTIARPQQEMSGGDIQPSTSHSYGNDKDKESKFAFGPEVQERKPAKIRKVMEKRTRCINGNKADPSLLASWYAFLSSDGKVKTKYDVALGEIDSFAEKLVNDLGLWEEVWQETWIILWDLF